MLKYTIYIERTSSISWNDALDSFDVLDEVGMMFVF